ncbi:anthranilate phosphoribosyltransferase, partial [Candidatus Peregrinibacteria bacterium]|nr:anthranilate phosphoribosyltransferase [Candidatus Peregrinibacteria bacterium]
VGYFGYDLVRFFESEIKIPEECTSLHYPEAIFIIPRIVVVFDHFGGKVEIIIRDRPEKSEKIYQTVLEKLKKTKRRDRSMSVALIKEKKIKNFSYQTFVKKAKEAICAGEVVQVVLSQEKIIKTTKKPFDLYRSLRVQNPSPYMFYLKYPHFAVIGASPETLVKVKNGKITLRPIAGTKPRGFSNVLRRDPKERAEHMMLLDLGRNDVGKCAKIGSIKVKKPMHIEKYSHVMHMVSEVSGILRKDKTIFDVFQTCFPAGTLTGAPKVRAMQLISSLEKKRRGLYGGAVGYFDMNGNMDFAIAIRTMIYKKKQVSIQAGAGIVYDSIPEKEDMECFHKMSACLAVAKTDLSREEARTLARMLIDSRISDEKKKVLLRALTEKGETEEEIEGFAEELRERMIEVPNVKNAIDTCGTGGSGLSRFNVSTLSAFILAAGGVSVAKHGGKAASGRCGSFDLLENLGIRITLSPKEIQACFDRFRLSFLFAPLFHPAMKAVKSVRASLGCRTIFNFLGPLLNPARVKRQVLGISSRNHLPVLANILSRMGTEHAMLLHGKNNLDEITMTGKTYVYEVKKEKIQHFYMSPENFGLKTLHDFREIGGGNINENSRLFLQILQGEKKGALRDLVLANASAGFFIAPENASKSWKDGYERAKEVLESGRAYQLFQSYRQFTQNI